MKFQVGDMVRGLKDYDGKGAGEVGVVRRIADFIEVEFGADFDGHNLNSTLTEHGWYYRIDEAERYLSLLSTFNDPRKMVFSEGGDKNGK